MTVHTASGHSYAAFGMVIRSDITLDVLDPHTPVVGTKPDLEIRRVSGLKRPERHPVDPFFDITPEVQYLYWHAIGTFVIPAPDTMLVEPHPDISDHLVSQALLGLVLSLVLERRGMLCLHASAVQTGEHVAVFLGDKGAGKSTTCGAMLARGHVPVSDDLVPIDLGPTVQEAARVHPGFPAMKIWPDTRDALDLGVDGSGLRVHPLVEKLQVRMPVPVAAAPVALGALFVLDRRRETTTPNVRRMPPHQALQAVMRYTFMARYGETRLGQAHLASHMRRCSAVVAKNPVYWLDIPEDLGALDSLAATIETARATL